MQCDGKRAERPATDWQTRRALIADGVLDLYLEQSWPAVSIEKIARRNDLGYGQVYRSFDGQEDIYRTAVSRLVEDVAMLVAKDLDDHDSVRAAIRNHVRHAANVIRHEKYVQLLLLRIRDEKTEPWIGLDYERKVAEPIKTGLKRAIADTGHAMGMPVTLLYGADDRHLRALETSLAIPQILYGQTIGDGEVERAVAAVSKDLLSSTCASEVLFGDTLPGPTMIEPHRRTPMR